MRARAQPEVCQRTRVASVHVYGISQHINDRIDRQQNIDTSNQLGGKVGKAKEKIKKNVRGEG